MIEAVEDLFIMGDNGGLSLDGEFAQQIHNDADTLGIQSGVQPVHNNQGSPSAYLATAVAAWRGVAYSPEMSQDGTWIAHFPGLAQLDEGVRKELVARSRVVSLPAGSRIFGPGQAPENFLLLIEGTLRVQQVSPAGREIVLYRVSAGESCALTTACLMSYEEYLAEAIAEADIRAVAVPRTAFDDLIARSADFRRFVFTAFSQRVTNLFKVIDDIVFARLDIRLAQRLLDLAGSSDHLTVTPQQVAAEPRHGPRSHQPVAQ